MLQLLVLHLLLQMSHLAARADADVSHHRWLCHPLLSLQKSSAESHLLMLSAMSAARPPDWCLVHRHVRLALPAAAAGAGKLHAAASNVAVGSRLLQQPCHDTLRVTHGSVNLDCTAAVELLWRTTAARCALQRHDVAVASCAVTATEQLRSTSYTGADVLVFGAHLLPK